MDGLLMFRRGFMRVVGLALLILCVAAWLRSYWISFAIWTWQVHPGFGGWQTTFIEINYGRFAMGWPNWSGNLSMDFAASAKWQTPGFMGFYIEDSFIIAPFWFLTIL